MHVLLTEDDRLLASGIVAGLRQLGLTMNHVDSAAQARVVLPASHFDVCVLDPGLPDEDGMLLLAHWRAQIDTIAHLLLRVQDAIERERRFTDNAVHELRTPLTAIKMHLQVLRQMRLPPGCGQGSPAALSGRGR